MLKFNFSAKKTVEEQLAAALAENKTLAEQIAGITKERDDAKALSGPLETQLAEANAARTKAESELANVKATLATTEEGLSNFAGAVRDALHLSDEHISAISTGDFSVLPAAVDSFAKRKAFEIAAGQGAVPPVTTAPNPTGSQEDETKLAFEQASQEPDPRKRAQMFQKASAMVDKKPHGKN